jgi:hypothetical protein
MRKTHGPALFGLLALVVTAGRASAADTPGPRFVAGVAALASGSGGGLLLDTRLRLRGGQQLGLAISGQASSVGYLDGYRAQGVATSEAGFIALLPFARARAVEMDVRLATGLRYLRDTGTQDTPHPSALRSVSELGCLAHVRLDERHLLRAGALIVVELQTQPSTALADQMQLITFGIARALSPDVLLYATVEGGGTFGFDGDNGKTVLRGALGLRLPFGADVLTAF